MTADAGVPLPASVLDAFGAAAPLAARYERLLANEGVEWGLIGPRESGRLWDRHVLNSLAVCDFIAEAASVVDVGSGAGLPGVPVALARPDLRITLLEPLERRVTFLHRVVDELGLGDRVTVVRDRAENHGGTYDVVTCRAVAALPKLVAWTAPLFLPSGRLVALKGESAADEVARARQELRKAGLLGEVRTVRVTPDADPTRVVLVQAR